MNPIICIPTFNEELNIKKSLKKLRWAKKIIILDSKSTDKTIEISKKFKNVKLISLKKSYDYVSKLNYLINKTKNKWILLLDADYVLSNELIKKIKHLDEKAINKLHIIGFKIPIYNKIFNTIIKEDIYPKKILLFKNYNFKFKRLGHGEKLYFNNKGKVKILDECIFHENLKDLNDFYTWKKNQIEYSKKDALRITKKKYSKLRLQDKIRRLIPINILMLFFFLIFFKKIFFYKKAGVFYLYQRLFYEYFLSISIFKLYLNKIKFFIRR